MNLTITFLMARRKREHFAEMKGWAHVIEPDYRYGEGLPEAEGAPLRGQWGERVILELGCGQGHYTLALAARHPDATVVGVDLKGSRLWHGARLAIEEGLLKARFLRLHIEDLATCFNPKEVDEIWITFPDPHLREGKAKKRLTSPRFLSIYHHLLKEGGSLYLKTDSTTLYDYTCEQAVQAGFEGAFSSRDLYSELPLPSLETALAVQTHYENRYLKEGKPICFLHMLKA